MAENRADKSLKVQDMVHLPMRPEGVRGCSVIVVSYRTGPILIHCLRSVLVQDGLHQLILVDNGNTTKLMREVQDLALEFPQLEILSGHGNVGFAAACNLGARRASGQYLLLLNPDCVMPPTTLRHTMSTLVDRPDASVVSIRVDNIDGSEQRGGRRNLMTPWTSMVEMFRLDRLAPNHPSFKRLNLHETEISGDIVPVQCTTGAFMMMRTETYRGLGGMDEDYFLHVEDVDFCMRLAKTGQRIVYLPRLRILHLKSTSHVSPVRIEWYKTKSAIIYFRKHFTPAYSDLLLNLIAFALISRFAYRCLPTTMRWVAKRLRQMGSRDRDAQQLGEIVKLKLAHDEPPPPGQ